MKLVCTPNLFNDIRNSILIIDTCILIDASKYEELDAILRDIQQEDCSFISVPAVQDEFVCNANSTDEHDWMLKFIKSFNIGFFDINKSGDRIANEYRDFNILLSHCKNIRPSYADRQLLAIPYLYSNLPNNIYLVTSNHKDVPKNLFDRIHFISYDTGEFFNIGIYKLNLVNTQKMVKNLIQKPQNLQHKS